MARKKHEINNSQSCFRKASDDEMIFVIRSKDKAAKATVEFWIAERIRLGLNSADDPKLQEARDCAQIMADEQERY